MIEFPEVFRRADVIALDGQRRYLRARVWELAMFGAVVGSSALWGVLEQSAWVVVAIVAFTAAIAPRISGSRSEASTRWYQGRAAAESVKTLAWRYAVGGEPFPIELKENEALDLLSRALADVTTTVDALPGLNSAGSAVTEWMRKTRANSSEQRRAVYSEFRLKDQRNWYAAKTRSNRRREKIWNLVIVLLGIVGVLSALAVRLDVTSPGLLGAIAAAAMGFVAWSEVKKHSALAEAYELTGLELERIGVLMETSDGVEEHWAGFIADCEDAISREHTMWAASTRSRRWGLVNGA